MEYFFYTRGWRNFNKIIATRYKEKGDENIEEETLKIINKKIRDFIQDKNPASIQIALELIKVNK